MKEAFTPAILNVLVAEWSVTIQFLYDSFRVTGETQVFS